MEMCPPGHSQQLWSKEIETWDVRARNSVRGIWKLESKKTQRRVPTGGGAPVHECLGEPSSSSPPQALVTRRRWR